MLTVEMKHQVMFQTNNDIDDLGDFVPHIMDYLNDGYDRLVYAWAKVHTSDDEDSAYPRLHMDDDVPKTPDWTHRAIVDWATWMIYRNGNPQKQQRGYAFRQSFDDTLSRISSSGGEHGRVTNFINIPR